MLRTKLFFVSCVFALGCARPLSIPVERSAAPSAEASPVAVTEVRDLYRVGEERYAGGKYVDAAHLFAQALQQLPSVQPGGTRHQLVMRLTHTQMRAWHETGNLQHLLDARAHLYRHLRDVEERIVAVRGADAPERADIFAQLHEVEGRLQAHLAELDSPSDPSIGSPAPPTIEIDDANIVAEVRSVEPTMTEQGEIRVEVPSKQGLQGPDVQERLRSRFSDPGPFLVELDNPMLHGPRPLVRLASWPVALAGEGSAMHLRQLGREIVRSSREGLRECYAQSFARTPYLHLMLDVEVEMRSDGSATVEIAEGALGDLEGNRCVTETIERVIAEQNVAPGAAVQLRLPLVFFYQAAHYFDELYGGAFPEGAVRAFEQPLAPSRTDTDPTNLRPYFHDRPQDAGAGPRRAF